MLKAKDYSTASTSSTKAEGVTFSNDRPQTFEYPPLLPDKEDHTERERLFYTTVWLKHCQRANDRDVQAILGVAPKSMSTPAEPRGLELQIDADYKKKKDFRFQTVVSYVKYAQTQQKDADTMASTCAQLTAPAQEAALERAKADAQFVQEMPDLEEEGDSAMAWILSVCDCFHPLENPGHHEPTTKWQSSLAAPLEGTLISAM